MDVAVEKELSEVMKDVARMEQANELVLFLLSKYEESLTPEKAPEGCSFHELYDADKVIVRPKYFQLYEEVKSELAKRGLDYP